MCFIGRKAFFSEILTKDISTEKFSICDTPIIVNSRVAITTMGPKCISLLVHNGAVDVRRFRKIARGIYWLHRARLPFRPHGTPQFTQGGF